MRYIVFVLQILESLLFAVAALAFVVLFLCGLIAILVPLLPWIVLHLLLGALRMRQRPEPAAAEEQQRLQRLFRDKYMVVSKLSERAYTDDIYPKVRAACGFPDDDGYRVLENKWGFRVCHVLWNDDEIVVAFRGSQALWSDWIATDLRLTTTPMELGGKTVRVHSGFKHALDAPRQSQGASLYEELKATLEEAGGGGARSLYVTGHSLGGALAAIAAAKLQADGVEVAGVFTFGQPAVGNTAFRRVYDDDLALRSRTFRFANLIDFVSFLPPLLTGGYRHIGRLVWYDGDAYAPTDITWIARLFKGLFRRIQPNHLMSQYLGFDSNDMDDIFKFAPPPAAPAPDGGH